MIEALLPQQCHGGCSTPNRSLSNALEPAASNNGFNVPPGDSITCLGCCLDAIYRVAVFCVNVPHT